MKTWDIDDKVDAVYEMRMNEVNHAMRTGGPATGGLTVLDAIAMAAMQGLLANANMGDSDLHKSGKDWIETIVSTSYEFAAEAMKERERTTQEPCSVEEAFGL